MRLFERLGVARAERMIPIDPGLSFVGVLKCHKESVVVKPVLILLAESLELGIRILFESVISNSEHLKAVVVQGTVIHSFNIAAEIILIKFMLSKEAILHKILQADKVRVSGKCGKTLIGGITKPGRSERKHLPIALTRFFQEIHKVISFLRKTPDTIAGPD